MKTTATNAGLLRLTHARMAQREAAAFKLLLLLGTPAAFLLVADAHALDIVFAQARGNPNGVTVTFSAPVSASSATNPANYSINNGMAVSNVTLLEAAKVRLNTSLIAQGQVYTLTVNNLQDTANPPRAIAPNSRINFLQTQGVITRKEFHDIGGTRLSDLTNHAKFPDRPMS